MHIEFPLSTKSLAALIVMIAASQMAIAQGSDNRAVGPEPTLLWPEGAPGAVGEEPEDRPEIRIYEPTADDRTETAVVICPGGGYGALATDHEGHQVAKWFGRLGVTGVVLKYRLGRRYQHPAPLQDVQRALRYVRAHAKELGVRSDRVGVMGFSAGGHLASTASTHWDRGDEGASDPIDRQTSRPDFAILAYPVISFLADFKHSGSQRNLLGENPDPELVRSLSNETQVTSETPPTFLFHTAEDKGVPVENSLVYFRALREHNVSAELHVYQYGPHGVGLAPGDPVLGSWPDRLAGWLQTNGFLDAVERVSVSGDVTLDGEPLRWGTITFTPIDRPRAPVAWDRISRGKYSIPQQRGLVPGTSKLEIRSLGTVAPYPTQDDVSVLMTLQVDVLGNEGAAINEEMIMDLNIDSAEK